MGSRSRISVPPPSRFSIIILAVSSYSTFRRSATLAMPMPMLPKPSGRSSNCAAPLDFRRQSVLDAVFNQRLQQHARHHGFERRRIEILDDLELVPSKTYDF